MNPIGGSGLVKLATKLKSTKQTLLLWNKQVFSRVDLHIKKLEETLFHLEEQLQCSHDMMVEASFLDARSELDNWKK